MKYLKTAILASILLLSSLFARNVDIAWNANPETNLTQYRIYRLDNGAQTLLATPPANVTTATVNAETGWEIAMTAYNGSTITFEPLRESVLSASVIVPAPSYVIPPASDNWAVVSASSVASGFPAINAIDKNPATFWATNYESINDKLPQFIILDLGKQRLIDGWSYTPRQDGYTGGHLENWRISFSLDNIAWTVPISGSFLSEDKTAKTFSFSSQISARFLKLECLTEISGKTTHVVVAEIGIIEGVPVVVVPPPSKPTGLKVTLSP